MKKQFALTIIAGTLLGLPSLSAFAHGSKHSDADIAIEYRRSAFHMIKFHFDIMGDMVKGKQAYDQATFMEHAQVLQMLSQMPAYGFPAEHTQGKLKNEAKAEIWKNRADFDEKMESFQVEAVNLSSAAESGDMDKIKPQFGKTGQSCKACHDSYREE